MNSIRNTSWKTAAVCLLLSAPALSARPPRELDNGPSAPEPIRATTPESRSGMRPAASIQENSASRETGALTDRATDRTSDQQARETSDANQPAASGTWKAVSSRRNATDVNRNTTASEVEATPAPKSPASTTPVSNNTHSPAPPKKLPRMEKLPPVEYGAYYAPPDQAFVPCGGCGCAPPCGCGAPPPCGSAPSCGAENACGAAPSRGCQASGGCGCAGGRCRQGRCERCPLHCPECEPWRLFPCGVGPCGMVTAGGWIAAGGSFADGDPSSKYIGPVTFNDLNELQGNQAYAFIERKIDNGGCGFDIGGRIDALYGTDHRFTMARGLETTGAFGPKWNKGGSNTYGLALPQAYLEVAYNDVSFKLGHYYTIIGYETVMAPDNFFYSHAYTMQYGEPFTHTGALGSYQATDELTLYAGVDRGWDNWLDDNANESIMWGAAWDSGCGTTITATGTWGKEFATVGAARNDDRTLVSVVVSQDINSRLTYVLQTDIGRQDNGAPANGQSAEWYGLNQYLTYKINCCWTAGLRMEWFRDDDGTRVTGLGFGNPIAGSQFAGNFYEITLGLNYQRNCNLTIRPELRYDEYVGQRSPVAAALPYGDGVDTKQFSAAVDLIFTF